MKKNGFTLIEIIAVIIIIGVLLLIAIPSVSGIIFSSRDSAYSNNISSFISEIDTIYKSKGFGPLLDDNQIMIVPLKDIEFEKNDTKSSPYGAFDLERSYVIIERSKYGYKLYASVIDSTNRGVFEKPSDELNNNSITMQERSLYDSIFEYFRCDGTDFDVKNKIFNFKGGSYKPVEARNYNKVNCSAAPDYYPQIILEKQS